MRTEMTAGAAEFRRNRRLLLALVFSAIAYFAFFLYDALIALLAADFGLDATAFGLGIAASGAGGLIGALVAGRFASHPVACMTWSAVLSGSVTIAIALAAMNRVPVPAGLYFGALAVMGGSTAFMLVPYRTIVQAETPPDRIARVFATGEALITAVMLSAPFIGSLIATAYGTGAAFLSGGALVLLLGLVTAATMLRRKTG